MLSLMCSCFNLDLAAAKPVFYSDPFFDLEMKRVLVDRDTRQILSCLTLVPTAVRVDSSLVLPICGVAGVCTQPEMRNHGLASRLIEATLDEISSDHKFAVTALTAARPELYEALGWRNCAIALDWSAPATLLPRYQEGTRVRELTQDEAALRSQDIHRCYDQASGGVQPGAFIRDGRRWRAIEKLTVGRRVAIYERDGVVVGYVAYEQRIGTLGKEAIIHEILARDHNSQRAILGYFATGALGSNVHGRCSHSEATTLGLFGLRGITFHSKPDIYVRIAHLTKALSSILSHTPPTSELVRLQEGLAIRVEDTDKAESEGDLASGRNRAVLRAVGKKIQVSPDLDSVSIPHWIAGDVGSVTQMLIGFKNSAELVSEGKLRTSGTGVRHICDALFPRFEPFLAIPDIF